MVRMTGHVEILTVERANTVHILVAWDNAAQAELVTQYLSLEDNVVDVVTSCEGMLEKVESNAIWDIVLMTTHLPTLDDAYNVFEQIRRLRPECPILGVCDQQDVFRIARFMTAGMRSYVLRDSGADFVFLLQATLENIVAAVQAEREQQLAGRLREEIESVRKLQESIIPQDILAPVGYEICGRYETSEMQVLGGQPVVMAGGDYYDVFNLDSQNVVILIGDASGHGMKACMSIMTMHTLVLMIRDESYQDPAVFVAEVNRRLCQQSIVQSDGGFITLLYGLLNTERHEFRWASAGHSAPVLHHLENNTLESFGPANAGGLPLGIYEDVEYESYTSAIPAASRLLLYTDGLIEAFPERAEEHREFSISGVHESMKRTRQEPLKGALQALFHDSHVFTEGSGRHDDTSAVIIERIR